MKTYFFNVPTINNEVVKVKAANIDDAAIKAAAKGIKVCGKITYVSAAAAAAAAAEPEAAAEAAKVCAVVPEAAAENAVSGYKAAKDFTLKGSKGVGSELDKKDKSLKGFARKVENEVRLFGVESPYFVAAMKAYIKDAFVCTAKDENEAEAAAAAKYAEFSVNMLENTYLYRCMKNNNKLFGALKANLCRYYDSNGIHIAAVKKIAYAVDAMSKAEVALYQEKSQTEKPTYKAVTISGKRYYVPNTADAAEIENGLEAVRYQARKNFEAAAELPINWMDEKGNIYTLIEKSTFGYNDFVPVMSHIMYCKAAEQSSSSIAAAKAAAKAAKAEKAEAKAAKVAKPDTAALCPLKAKAVVSAASAFDADMWGVVVDF